MIEWTVTYPLLKSSEQLLWTRSRPPPVHWVQGTDWILTDMFLMIVRKTGVPQRKPTQTPGKHPNSTQKGPPSPGSDPGTLLL